ncbi:MAG: crossover junction endodeoxyribonuclease RuvC [Pelagibacterales bacterium]|nr:crossover junction endodeoxyribonuclease RuvC [Pelagibacterales bacterium]PPR16943.1 MAG: Crossover junction endodeoxyribonuclease RuvC [Alphaproteobacteria bacterium MarineAlpha9_Bin3]
MRLLGLDPGLRHTGWGIINTKDEKIKWVASGSISPKSSLPLSIRLKEIHIEINKVIKEYSPKTAAVEEVFVNMNGQSTLKLGMARGAAITTCSIHNIQVFEYAPTRVKQSLTGSGRALKEQVKSMVKILLPGCKIESEDESDALAVAICHTFFSQSKINNIDIGKINDC